MTREETMKMLEEAGIYTGGHPINPLCAHIKELERFAELVAVHEREACTKVVEAYTGAWSDEGYALVQAIRARGGK